MDTTKYHSMIYLDDILSDIENFSDHELPLSSILTIDDRLNPTKWQEIDMNDNKSDNDSFSDNELPLSSISNMLLSTHSHNILNHEVKKSKVADCPLEIGIEHNYKLDTHLKSNNKQTTIDNSIKKYECDICGKIFRKRNLIIEHFKTSLCYPECSFYFENDESECSWFSRSENSFLYCNSMNIVTTNNNKNDFNHQYHTNEIQDNKLIKNNQVLNTKEINLNLNVFSNYNNNIHENTCNYVNNLQTFKESFYKLLIIEALEFIQFNSMYFNNDVYKELCLLYRSIDNHNLNHKQFSGLSFSTRHKRILNFKNTSQRSICHKKLKTESNVSKPISKKLNKSQNYECSKCSKVFYERTEIISHIYDNHQEVYSKYSCDTCSRLYKSSQEFILHIDKNCFKCDVCPQSFTTSYRLHQHYRWHLGINDYQCQYCPKTFSNFSVYLHHERTHTGEKPFRCNFCGKWFPVSSNMNIHLITHKPFVCYICQKAFDLLSLLLSHKIVHKQNELLTNKSYNKIAQSNTLKLPTIQFNGKEMIKCNVCCKSFIQLSVLISHLKTHVSKNLHNANISRGIITKLSLDKIKQLHINKRYFQCNLCQEKVCDQNTYVHRCTSYKHKMYPKVLSNNYLYKKNKSIHNFKTFKCDICKKLFMHSTSLKRHKKKHINQFEKVEDTNINNGINKTGDYSTVDLTCDLCMTTFNNQSQFLSHILDAHY